tara:strand:- start:968 stop:1075 length:108 start_codon:yes stop_codon:yes gene_type:complete
MKSCGIGNYKAGQSSEIIFLNYIGNYIAQAVLKLR